MGVLRRKKNSNDGDLMDPYTILKDGAKCPQDAARFKKAFDMAWKDLADRAGDAQLVRDRLARLILMMGNRRLDISAEELATSVRRTFDARVDQD